MQQIMILLMFTSLGAILTMLLLPPLPVYHTKRYTSRDYPLQKMIPSKIYRDWETEPIIGITETEYQEMIQDKKDYTKHRYLSEE
jgi:hypothetical protein